MITKQKERVLICILLIALMVLYVFPTSVSSAGYVDNAPANLFGLRTGGAVHPNEPVKRAQAVYTTRPPVFGTNDEIWNRAKPYTVDQVIYDYGSSIPSKGVFRVLWDDHNLYVRVEVTDDSVIGGSAAPRQLDSVEVMVSERNFRGHLIPDNENEPTRDH